jgi:hypothetical protein
MRVKIESAVESRIFGEVNVRVEEWPLLECEVLEEVHLQVFLGIAGVMGSVHESLERLESVSS